MKALDAFPRKAGAPSGRYCHCRVCKAAADAQYHVGNRERIIAKVKQWGAANPERKAASVKAWEQANPAIKLARGALCRQRGPRAPWYDAGLVRDIYKLARIHRAAGIDCHVDHVVPLKGKTVSGLHVQSNLTVLLARDNRRKGSAAWPDMP